MAGENIDVVFKEDFRVFVGAPSAHEFCPESVAFADVLWPGEWDWVDVANL